jgi:ribosomal RNA assembly protein
VEQRFFVKIPLDRVGVLIGPKGKTKSTLEKIFRVTLDIESSSGSVEIKMSLADNDVSNLFAVQNVVKAIGRGFNPKKAEKLAEEDYDLIIIDLEDYAKSKNAIARIKGRIIGKDGSSRRMLEELTGTFISVYGDTVSIIGKSNNLETAREAVTMLIKGAFHKTVWNFLYAERRKREQDRIKIWEENIEN